MRKPAIEFCRIFRELYEAIVCGDYASFKKYYGQLPQPKNPNIIAATWDRYPAVSCYPAIRENLRIIAELLRDDAEIEFVPASTDVSAFLPHRAIISGIWPLTCLLLYLRGLEPFTTIRNVKDNTTAMEEWIRYGAREEHPYTEGYAFLDKVHQQKALIVEGDALLRQQKPFEAFKKYHQAACMVLDFHQGDANLVPFYQEEAIEPFFKAVQALIQDFTQAVPATTHLCNSANVKAGKQTHLILYVSDVLRKLGPAPGLDPRKDKDKMVDPARLTRFTDVIRTWQLPQTPINWSDPLLNDYNPSRPRSYSNDSDKSKDSAVGSAENLAKNTSA